MLSIDSTWREPADDEVNIAWTRDFHAAALPYSDGKTYFNFPGLLEEGEAAVRSTLRRQPRAAGANQGRVRPGEPLPAEPEHQAGGRLSQPQLVRGGRALHVEALDAVAIQLAQAHEDLLVLHALGHHAGARGCGRGRSSSARSPRRAGSSDMRAHEGTVDLELGRPAAAAGRPSDE